MIPNELVFAPERGRLRAEVLYSVLGIALLGPALMWWKDVPWRWWPLGLAAGLAIALAKDFYEVRIRGRDFVDIVDEGIRVTNRRRVWLMRWQDIHRVHRFKEQLVFESVAPHRRETLSLEGHDAHRAALSDAIAARARTLNLGWVETLADLIG